MSVQTTPFPWKMLDSVALQVVSEALVFNETQRHLANELQAKSHKGKCKQIVDSSKAKMAEVPFSVLW